MIVYPKKKKKKIGMKIGNSEIIPFGPDDFLCETLFPVGGTNKIELFTTMKRRWPVWWLIRFVPA